MDRLLPQLLGVLFFSFFGVYASAFELLSEGAMESVSAVSANTAEEIVSLAGPASAGLRVDDEYDSMPFQAEVSIKEDETDKVSTGLEFELTKEVENWAQNLQTGSELDKSNIEIGYVDVLPPSSFDKVDYIVNDSQFEVVIFDPSAADDEEENTVYELGRIQQTVDIIEQNLDSVQFVVRRHVDFLATINANPFNDRSSIGSGYITDLSSISNVKISTIRE